MSVCLSVLLSHSGIVSKWLNVGSQVGKYATDPSSARNTLSYGVKNVKIGAVDPEIFDEICQFFGHVIPDVHK